MSARRMQRPPPSVLRSWKAKFEHQWVEAMLNNYEPKVWPEGYMWTIHCHGDCLAPFQQSFGAQAGEGLGAVVRAIRPDRVWGPELDETDDFVPFMRWSPGEHPMSEPFCAKFFHRCRKCDKCHAWRADDWAKRCGREIANSEFPSALVTLTINDAWLNSVPSDVEPLAHLMSECAAWLKRMRAHRQFKGDGGKPLRYLLVPERGGKNGRLHIHAVIHGANLEELFPKRPDNWHRYSPHWHAGFTDVQMIATNVGRLRYAVTYVSKYMTKMQSEKGAGRLRASKSYGQHGLNHSHKRDTKPKTPQLLAKPPDSAKGSTRSASGKSDQAKPGRSLAQKDMGANEQGSAFGPHRNKAQVKQRSHQHGRSVASVERTREQLEQIEFATPPPF